MERRLIDHATDEGACEPGAKAMERCECGTVHMATHNAVCRYCADRLSQSPVEYDDEKAPSR